MKAMCGGRQLMVAVLALCTLGAPACSSDSPSPSTDPDGPGGNDGDGSNTPGDDTGDGAGGDSTATTPCMDCTDLFADFGTKGVVDFQLYPSPGAPRGNATTAAFAIPFPKNTLEDVSQLVITDGDGKEIATHVESLGDWHSIGEPSAPQGVRSALIFMKATFDSDSPISLQFHYGAQRTLELDDPGTARDTWVSVKDKDYSVALDEPTAYAALPTGWLSASLILDRALPTGDSDWQWFDEFFVNASHTAVNDVPAQVTSRIHYETEYAPWLFDRSSTLLGAYVRTGDVQWLRAAHRAAEFYRPHVDGSGYFDMRAGQDLKYSYGQSLVSDYFLTGNVSNLPVIEKVASAGEAWNETYSINSNFWTERHQTYALFAAVSAFEVTGKTEHANRAKEIIAATLKHIRTPPGGLPADGCLPHTFAAHEGVSRSGAVCSPWMSALLSDAVWRYYLVSEDSAALEVLSSLGDFVAEYGTYRGDALADDMLLPWYLASSQTQFSDSGPWADMEHSCDVGGLAARGLWAKKALGEATDELEATVQGLLDSCQLTLDYWHRPGGPASGLAEWRIQPPRKYSWWFKSTLDLSWLLLE